MKPLFNILCLRSLAIAVFVFCRYAAAYSETATFSVEPDDRFAPVLTALQEAEDTIDLVIFKMTSKVIVNELVAAKNRGVNVRILLNGGFPYDNELDANYFNSLGLDTRLSSRHYITHQKTFIIDGKRAFVLDYNFENIYFTNTRGFGNEVTSPAAVAEIESIFQNDWDQIPVTSATVPELVWSPLNAKFKLIALIDSAQKTLDIYALEVVYDDIIDALIRAINRGVCLRLIISSPNLVNPFIQEYDFLDYVNNEGLHQLDQVGAKIRFVNVPFIHAKTVIADYGNLNQIAFSGSQNFTVSSINRNRELGILTSQQQVLETLERTFLYDWNIAKDMISLDCRICEGIKSSHD